MYLCVKKSAFYFVVLGVVEMQNVAFGAAKITLFF
jgi:hypothetical protein